MRHQAAASLFKLSCLIIVGLSFLLGSAFAQTEDLSINIEAVDSQNFPQIQAEITVLDELGLPIQGLRLENFSLEEDRIPVEIETLEPSDRGVAVVLVIDTSESMFALPASREAALAFVDALRPVDSVALIDFDTTVTQLQGLTTEHDRVKTQINESLEQGGRTALYDGALAGVREATQAEAGRRVVILLADGNDSGDSVAGRDAALSLAQDENIPIYTIGLGAQADRTYLENIATLTNGVYFDAPNANALTDLYTNLAERLRQAYLITYTSQVPGDISNHNLSIEVQYQDNIARSVARFTSKELPPEITLSRPRPENGRLVVMPRVQAQGGNFQIQWYLDDAPLTDVDLVPPYAARLDPAQLQPGTYELRADVTDAAGLTASVTRDIEIEFLPPRVQIQGLPENATLGERPAEVRLRIESQTEIQAVEFQINDEAPLILDEAPFRFEIDPLTLPLGEHTLFIRVENEAERAFETVQQFTTTIKAPTVSFDNLPSDEFTQVQTITLDIDSQTDTYEVSWQLDGEPLAQGASPEQIELNPLALSPGEHRLSAIVRDERDLSSSVSTTITVPALAPKVVITGLEEGETLGTDPVTVALSINSQTEIENVIFTLNDNEPETQVIAPYRFEIDPVDLVSDGENEHELVIEIINQSGETTQETVAFNIDIVPPQLTLDGLPTDEPIDEAITLMLSVETATDYTVNWRLDGELLTPRQSADGYSIEIDPWDYEPQDYVMTIEVEDNLGLSSELTDQTFTIAALAPEVSLQGLSEDETLEGIREISLDIRHQTAIEEVSYTIGENDPVTVSNQAPYSYQLVPNDIGEGTHQLAFSVTDANGQTTSETINFAVSSSAIQPDTISSDGGNNTVLLGLIGIIALVVVVGGFFAFRTMQDASPVKGKVLLKYHDPVQNKDVEYRVKKEETHIGRASGNDIILLDPNTTISRQHATLKMSGLSWIIKDLDSHSGTVVNGKRIKESQMLGHMDEIEIGPIKLTFVAPQVKVKTQDLAATRFQAPPDIPDAPKPDASTKAKSTDQPETPPDPKRRLTMLKEDETDKSVKAAIDDDSPTPVLRQTMVKEDETEPPSTTLRQTMDKEDAKDDETTSETTQISSPTKQMKTVEDEDEDENE